MGKGVALALFGVLVLTPDALLMRLSGMDGAQMLGWRSTTMGLVLIVAWLFSRMGHWRADAALVFSGAGLAIAASQGVNGALFTLGIVNAPVTLVLLGVATVPIFAALFAWVLMGEPTGRATRITIGCVLVGIALSMADNTEAVDAMGIVYGLGVAICLSLSFVLIRRHGAVPILPSVGLGALGAGLVGAVVAGPEGMMEDAVLWPILVTGAVVLPVSFYCLSLASRFTAAANVSLVLLLETVLGPLWVWWGIGEAPTPMMVVGGAIVVGSLAVYLRRGAIAGR